MEKQLTSIYSYQSLVHSVNIFNYSSEYSDRLYLYGIRYLFQYRHNDNRLCPSLLLLTTTIRNLFNSYKTNQVKRTYVLEIIDILLEFDVNYGNQCVHELKAIEDHEQLLLRMKQDEIETFRQNKNAYINTKQKSIYTDTQNVHTSTINESVKNMCRLLVTEYRPRNSIYQIESQLISLFPSHISTIQNVILRIRSDVSTFGINISLYQVFMSLCEWIHQHEYKIELRRILVNEMKEMEGYCATGHLSRLINVTQGFSEMFNVSISPEEQCNAVVRQFLTKQLQECTDTVVIDGMLTKSDEFQSFIHNIIHTQLDNWLKEYGQVFCSFVNDIVDKYIHT